MRIHEATDLNLKKREEQTTRDDDDFRLREARKLLIRVLLETLDQQKESITLSDEYQQVETH